MFFPSPEYGTFYTSPEDIYPIKTSDILDKVIAYAKHETGSTSCERVDQVPIDHEIPSVFGSQLR
jgi:hypothetical protein